MRIARFSTESGPRVGLVVDGHLVDLARTAQEQGLEWAAPLFTDLRRFLVGGEEGRSIAAWLGTRGLDGAVPLAQARLLAPAELGAKLLAHVVNYAAHGKEGGGNLTPPEMPFFFWKHTSGLVGQGGSIVGHSTSAKVDYEAELAVVIGRRGRDIARAAAYDHVAGYTIANDISFRDFQTNEACRSLTARYGQNWVQGKALDGACPMGPWIVLSDEIAVPYPLQITCRVNGEVRQDDSTESMVFKVPALIEAASRGMTLEPGDVVLTGTPAGSGIADGRYLRPGDVVETAIESIGVLVNRVA